MLTILWSVLAFLVAITVLVAFHEFGHLWVARRCGVKILRFSIGFGKPFFRYIDKRGTEFVLAYIPFGGYVKMLDENEGDVPESELAFAFNRKPVWQRMLVVLAGPVFNIIFAVFAYWLMFTIGVSSLAPILGNVTPQSLAAKAALEQGDEILAINNQTVTNWQDVNLIMLQHLGEKQIIHFKIANKDKSIESRDLDLTEWKLDSQQPNLLGSLGLTPFLPEVPTVISKVISRGPADVAGFKPGDKILSVDQHTVRNWSELTDAFNQTKEKQVAVTVLRQQQLLTLQVSPIVITTKEGKSQAHIGIQSEAVKIPPELLRKTKYPFFSAWGHAVSKTYSMINLTFGMLYKMIVGHISVKSISGPVGIAQGAGYSARMGFTHYLDFIALISISLGVINVLPIPMLDGGHFLFYVIEVIRRKPLSARAQALGMRLGFALLITFMLLAIFNDLGRLFT